MFRDEFLAASASGKSKLNLLQKNPGGFFVSAILAGIFISFGSFLCYAAGTPFKAAGSPFTKPIMGFCFSVALSLVVTAGSELFTGNIFILSLSSLGKTITWTNAAKVLSITYIGNLAGTFLAVFMFQLTGIPDGAIGEHFAAATASKMSLPPVQLLFRSILCNILVCLAVWISIRIKSESAKLIMIFWCIFTFMVCGFEHSVANMGILAVGLLNAGTASVSIGGYFYNLLLSTVGNIIGGSVFLALPYYLISRSDP